MSVEVMPVPSAPEHAAEAVDPERAQMYAFQEQLGDISYARKIETAVSIDGEQPIATAAKDFITHDRRFGIGNQLYIHEDVTELTAMTGVQFLPRKSRGGKRSAHGVFFGDLVTDDGHTLPVAVKPHVDDPEASCTTDYFGNVAAQKAGFQTLEPVGMLFGEKGEAYSMTRLEEPLTTLDSIDWKYVFANEADYPELLTAWSQVSRQAAMLHAAGSMAHNDLAPRNIAMRPDNSGVFFIDWEHARLSTAQPRDAEVRYVFSRADLGELMEGLVRPKNHPHKAGIGLLSDHPEPWRAFSALIFDEYVDTRLSLATPKEQADVHDELVELESSLKLHLSLLLMQQQRAPQPIA